MTRRTPAATCLLAVLPALALPLAACTTPPACPAGLAARVQDTLFFGTARADGVVGPAQWQDFVDREITPRFPDGLTTWVADGQWRGAAGTPVHERSHVLLVVHAGDVASDAALAALVHAYKQRFAQESVLRVRGTVCVAF